MGHSDDLEASRYGHTRTALTWLYSSPASPERHIVAQVHLYKRARDTVLAYANASNSDNFHKHMFDRTHDPNNCSMERMFARIGTYVLSNKYSILR